MFDSLVTIERLLSISTILLVKDEQVVMPKYPTSQNKESKLVRKQKNRLLVTFLNDAGCFDFQTCTNIRINKYTSY